MFGYNKKAQYFFFPFSMRIQKCYLLAQLKGKMEYGQPFWNPLHSSSQYQAHLLLQCWAPELIDIRQVHPWSPNNHRHVSTLFYQLLLTLQPRNVNQIYCTKCTKHSNKQFVEYHYNKDYVQYKSYMIIARITVST